jgi:subtilase family serine protease
MQFPDVEPLKIQVNDLPGRAEKQVCMTVVNWGPGHAGVFQVTLRVNGNVPPDGRYTVGVLAAKTDYLTCVMAILPTAGQYRLTAVADEARTLIERDESNNVFEQSFSATPSSPVSNAAQADLTVSAVRVNGQVPDGKGHCKAGKNAVAVLVKNGGDATAGELVVRLVVDNAQDDALERSVSGLEAGKEREVRFDDVRLKQGERQLRVVVDATSAVAESNEDNNDLTVTAGCQGGN